MSNLPLASPDGADSLSQMMGLAATREHTPSSKSDELSLVHQGKNVMIFRCNSMGKKVFRNTVDNQEEILAILEHERRVSNYLSPSCPHRKVQSLDSYKGCLGFNFDWVEGVTLKVWLMKQDLERGDQEVDLLSRLPVAIAIVKAVASLHAAGVAHASICSDNIILSFDSKQCSATLIDLAKAVILSDESASVKNEDAHLTNDMKALGSVLYSVLGGEPTLSGQKQVEPVEEDSQARTKRGRNDEQAVTSMPLYLTSLLSALIAPSLNVGGTFEYQYQNANDVLHDLQEAAKKPELYLKPYLPSKNVQMSVQIPVDSFYGRLSEVTILKQSLDIVKKNGGQPIVISVSGYAGAG
jgi:serine/threonine protein kinase